MNRRLYGVIIGVAVLIIAAGVWVGLKSRSALDSKVFNGQTALAHVEYQVYLGPRLAGTPAHSKAIEYFISEMDKAGWDTSVQESNYQGQAIRNVVGKRGSGSPWTILGAHYDSRLIADQDPDLNSRDQPVPGANDGASGSAVLLELAASLPQDLPGQIWLVFFDAEDNGNISGWDWILGSRAFVAGLTNKPDAAVIVDMIGDADLNIYLEQNSDQAISEQIWDEAEKAGYQKQFIPTYRHSMLDDHTPFLQAGIPAVDIIDFDYPFWHTTSDTVDKISAESLEAVGVTLQRWLDNRHQP